MQRRTATKAFSRRQPPGGHQGQRPRIQPGQGKVKVSSQPVANNKVPPINSTVPPRRSPAVKGKIPPFNPNTVKVEKIPPFNPKAVKSAARVRKQVMQKKSPATRKKRLKPIARTILYAVRLLIVGIGIGAIVGTVLSVFDPASRIIQAGVQSNPTGLEVAQPQQNANPSVAATGVSLTQENSSLKTTVQSLAVSNTQLTPGVFLVDLDNGAYVDVNGDSNFPAASTIKIPIIIAFFQDVDAGKIRLDEKLTLQRLQVAGGSGDMQYKPVGTQFTAQEVATKMMTISDNTATNMLITRLGGIEALNQRFRSWGLTNTVIRNLLPDLLGTNTTSPKELGNLLAMVGKGNLVSMPSRDRLLNIMRHNTRNHLLPTGLGPGATIAHKTGDISTMLADVGLVDMPSGKRYILAVMVQRPNNDPSAESLIRSISQVAYQQFSQTAVTPNGMGSAIPPTTYQPPVINPLPNNAPNAIPPMGYQSPPMMSPPLANPNGSVMPPTGYQPPVMTPPQYYYPYQR